MSRNSRPPWIWLLGLFFLLVVGDGALRKWVMPSQSLVLFLLKDAVLLGALGFYWFDGNPVQLPRPVRRHTFSFALGLYVYVVLVQAVNLSQPSWMVSVLGLKSHLAYVPLVILLPAFLHGWRRRQPEGLVLGYMMGIALPIMLLGIYQFFQPPGSWINQYVADTDHVAGIAGNPRITGTFSYIAGMATFLQANAILGFGVLVAGVTYNRKRLQWGGAVFLGLCLMVLPMTGSRSAIAFPAVLGLGLSVLLARRQKGLLSLVLGTLLVGGLVLLFLSQTGLGEGWEALQSRVEGAGDTESRFWKVFSAPIDGIERGGLLGYGVGTLHQAATRLVPGQPPQAWIPGPFIENGVASVIAELGALGWAALLAVKGAAAWIAYKVFRRASTPFELIVGVFALGMTIQYFYFSVVYRVTSAAIYWTAVGLVVYVWSAQQMRQESQVERTRAARR